MFFCVEIIGGIVIFLVMSYILVVNFGIVFGLWFGEVGIFYGGVFFVIVVGVFIVIMVMVLFVNLFIGLVFGMGVNVFFVGVIIG